MKGETKAEMAGWHQLNGHEFEQTPGAKLSQRVGHDWATEQQQHYKIWMLGHEFEQAPGVGDEQGSLGSLACHAMSNKVFCA